MAGLRMRNTIKELGEYTMLLKLLENKFEIIGVVILYVAYLLMIYVSDIK